MRIYTRDEPINSSKIVSMCDHPKSSLVYLSSESNPSPRRLASNLEDGLIGKQNMFTHPFGQIKQTMSGSKNFSGKRLGDHSEASKALSCIITSVNIQA